MEKKLYPSAGTSRAIFRTTVLCVLCVLTALLIAFWATRGVEVVICNKTGEELQSVRIEFTGGTKTVPTIEPDGVFRTRITPAGESHLELTYTHVSGKEFSKAIGVYFEPGYGGAVFIELLPNLSLIHI